MYIEVYAVFLRMKDALASFIHSFIGFYEFSMNLIFLKVTFYWKSKFIGLINLIRTKL